MALYSRPLRIWPNRSMGSSGAGSRTVLDEIIAGILMSRLAISRRFRRLGAALALFSAVANAAGCVERRMTVRSNPPGAAVYVDDYQIGTTPVAVNYTYYGTRKIRLVKDGFETLTVYQPMPAPWYQYFGIDFFSENIWPGKIRDERSYDYQMSPIVMVPNDQLLNRAEQLRSNGRAIPAAAVEPIVTGPATGVPPIETLPAPGTLPPADSLPPPGTYPQPSTLSPPINSAPINSAPLLPPSGTYTPQGTAPSYAPPGSSVYPPPGGAISPPPGNLAPTYSPPPAYGPGFSSPGGFGVGGSNAAPSPVFPESAPSSVPQYVPPPTTAPPAVAPPAAAPIPYSVPQGWHPMGQLPAGTGAPVTR